MGLLCQLQVGAGAPHQRGEDDSTGLMAPLLRFHAASLRRRPSVVICLRDLLFWCKLRHVAPSELLARPACIRKNAATPF